MGETERPWVPRLRAGADLKKLPLGPTEGFVVSRIDGATRVEEIGDLTGLGTEKVLAVIEGLVRDGAVEWVDPPKSRRRSMQAIEAQSGSRPPPAQPEARRPKSPPVPAEPPRGPRILYPESALDEPDIDLDRDRRKRILDTFHSLDQLTLYEVLGVEPDADKKEIKAAYFALSKVFHPDTLYGKRLGSFKAKMEGVFKRLTEAYDTLGKKRTRDEYDNYIRLRLKTKKAQDLLERGRLEAEEIRQSLAPGAEAAVVPPSEAVAPAADVEPLARTERPPPPAPSSPPPSGSARPPPPAPSSPPPRTAPSAPPPKAGSSPPPRAAPLPPRAPVPDRSDPPFAGPVTPPTVIDVPADRAMSADALDRKRQLMAKKIAAATGRNAPVRRSEPPPAGDKQALLRGLASTLKQTAVFTGGIDLAQRHVEEARRREEQGDLVSAANALRLALALAPDRPDIESFHADVSQKLAASLAGTYAEQADYEMRTEKWADASLSWSRVCEGRPKDADAHQKAAYCMLKANSDLAKAKTYAQRAVELAPDSFDAYKTLGTIFHLAGMTLNARRALERAAELDPSDHMVENLLRELRK